MKLPLCRKTLTLWRAIAEVMWWHTFGTLKSGSPTNFQTRKRWCILWGYWNRTIKPWDNGGDFRSNKSVFIEGD